MCVEWLVAVDIAVFAVFVLCDKKSKKFGGIKNIAYFCGQSWSRRKRTAAMKTQMNERIERYPRIEMWKFRNLLG